MLLAKYLEVRVGGKSKKSEIRDAVIKVLIESQLLDEIAVMLCSADESMNGGDSVRMMELKGEMATIRLFESKSDIIKVSCLVLAFDESDPEDFFI